MYHLADKTVLLTGAARGIGAETARKLAARGAHLALLDLDAGGLQDLSAELGEGTLVQQADVSDAPAVEGFVAETARRFGGIDVAVANAAINLMATVEDIEPADFRRVVEANLLGAFHTLRYALPHLLARKGYALCVSSGSALVQTPFQSPYNASKAALHAFANTLRQEVAPRGVDVGVVYFNAIDTDAARSSLAHPLITPLRVERLMKFRPVEEAAEAIIRGIERRSRTVYFPRQARLPSVSPALMQRQVDRWVARRLRGA
jgi:NAD(P)-dependent dehydrogenase (short-subunit alcohol dehydrogenase family)